MKLFIESLMIFFGTLLAAALVALGEPAGAEIAIIKSVTPESAASHQAHQRAAQAAKPGMWSATGSAAGMR